MVILQYGVIIVDTFGNNSQIKNNIMSSPFENLGKLFTTLGIIIVILIIVIIVLL